MTLFFFLCGLLSRSLIILAAFLGLSPDTGHGAVAEAFPELHRWDDCIPVLTGQEGRITESQNHRISREITE